MAEQKARRLETVESKSRMGMSRLFRAWLLTLICLVAVGATQTAHGQANSDRPGGDYLSAPVPSGDPEDCALMCERDRRCRAWTFSYPTDPAIGAVCWQIGRAHV